MSHGLPDYYRGVDIAYQALSEMIVRPKYGTAQSASDSIQLAGIGTHLLVEITGKGVIYGGGLMLDEGVTQKNDIPILTIDDYDQPQASFYNLNLFGITVEHSAPFYELKYDDAAFIYSVGLSWGYTFEEKFSIKYKETYGNTPWIFYRVMYALI